MKTLTKKNDPFIEFLWNNELNNEVSKSKRMELKGRIMNRWNLDNGRLKDKHLEIINILKNNYYIKINDYQYTLKLKQYHEYIINGGSIDDRKQREIEHVIDATHEYLACTD